MTTTLEAAKAAQRAYAAGTGDLDDMRAKQSAYETERLAPQREAEDARRKAANDAQREILASSPTEDQYAAIRAEAEALDCVRNVTVKGGAFKFYDIPCNFYVPPTSHWANWQDDDAVRHHGMTSIEDLADRFAALSTEPWDGTYAHLWTFAGLSD